MENGRANFVINVAAGAAGEVDIAPLTSTGKWKIIKITEVPNVALTADNTDYVTRTPYCGTTAIATAITTQISGGGALTARTPVNWTLTGNDSSCECSQAAPFNFRVAHSGSGKAYNCTIMVEYTERAP
jgi:hypothetical protein